MGVTLATRLAGEGHRVFGLRRRARELPEGVEPFEADLTDPDTLRALPTVDAIVYAAAPDARGEEAYRTVYVEGLENVLRASARSARVLFASSTAVYGQRDGSLVDETSETRPLGYRGRVLLDAEAVVAALGSRATVLRLAGLYGPGRARLLDAVFRGDAEYARGEIVNVIHRDDAAGVLRHLMTAPPGLYLGVDDEPVDKETLLRWLAARTGSPPPRERVDASPLAGGKRLSNRRLRDSGYEFSFPTFREGFESLLEGR